MVTKLSSRVSQTKNSKKRELRKTLKENYTIVFIKSFQTKRYKIIYLKNFRNLPSIEGNTGYAVDELLKSKLFGGHNADFNFCKLLTGSEGTLAFTTEITLQLDDLPPKLSAMVVTHYKTLEDCLGDVTPVMACNLFTCEMMDKVHTRLY